jgi:hypothetical protein
LLRTNDSDGDTVAIVIKSCEQGYCDRVAKCDNEDKRMTVVSVDVW